jgi:hypothetical protein
LGLNRILRPDDQVDGAFDGEGPGVRGHGASDGDFHVHNGGGLGGGDQSACEGGGEYRGRARRRMTVSRSPSEDCPSVIANTT